MVELSSYFQEQFGAAPACQAQAPGRLELLGNHTDYNEGLVLALAIDRHIAIAAAPRADDVVELVSTAYPERERFPLDGIAKNPAAPWANYVKGVLAQLRQRGCALGGFNAAIHGTIPLGAGLSSSAALEVASALVVRKLYPYTLDPEAAQTSAQANAAGETAAMDTAEKLRLAKLCQAAENQYVGVQCGLLDQISSLFGRAEHAIMIDCRDLTLDWQPFRAPVAVVVCNSGVKHALVGGEYNERRQQCEAAARALRVRSLRWADEDRLEQYRDRMPARAYQCARHILGENRRVAAGATALRNGDLAQLGQSLFESHRSSRDFFKNSCPELDLLVELAQAQPGCWGARLTGGGFGGATLNLVAPEHLDRFGKNIAAEYERRTNHALEPLVCRIVSGAA